MSSATQGWERLLQQGWAPAGADSRQSISSRDDLYDYIMDQTSRHGLGGYTQQDIYDFFIRPQEQQRMNEAQNRFRQLYGQATRIGQQRTGQLGARLGLGGTGLGARMARTIGSRYGGAAASRGLASAQEAAIRGIESPNRLSAIEDLASAGRARDERRAAGGKAGLQYGLGGAGSLLTAIGTGFLGASASPLAPVTAPIAALMMGIGGGMTAGGMIGGEGSAMDAMRRSDERAREYRGGPLQAAQFAPVATTGVGADYSPTGSSEYALGSAYGGGEEEDTDFLYG